MHWCKPNPNPPSHHQEAKLYLIFEYLTMDLKQYMDTQCGTKDQPMQPQLVKSWTYQLCQVGKDFDFEIIYFLLVRV